MRAAGVGAGDSVVLAANTGMYSTGAAISTGAHPVFADVDGVHGLLTAPSVERAIDGVAATPKAVVVTHLHGRLAAMDSIAALCRERGIMLVEDCAQAHGAAGVDGRKAGAYGDLATFSFYPTKNLGAVGDGGAVVCRDEALATRVRRLRQYGWSRKYVNEIAHGRNSRLDELQAALLDLFLPDLDARNSRRRDIANRYSTSIRHPGIRVPAAAGDGYVAHLYVVQCAQREALAAHLSALGVATDVHYPVPDHRQPVHGTRFDGVSLPETERLCREVLTLPCFPELEDDEIERVIAACNTWSDA
jgi:dTDP-4-amino-4,6-dideoxygalactose transaminase